jgi:glycyl-tRNA synthetase beta chain
MTEFLLELFSEEIPARMQVKACQDLERLVLDSLKKIGLEGQSTDSYVTPRRLVLVIKGLPLSTPSLNEERRGPRVGAPPEAIDGFLKNLEVKLSDCHVKETDKGEFYFISLHKEGQQTSAVLKDILEPLLVSFPWPKSMRWGRHQCQWIRPLERILCLFNNEVIPLSFDQIPVGRLTAGHRFLAPELFEVRSLQSYFNHLEASNVMLDHRKRRSTILNQALILAQNENLILREDDELLDEITGLVEWPTLLLGTIDPDFLSIPDEILITSMRSHQKYMSLLNHDGTLSNRFIIVANTIASDGGHHIIAGNEKVLRARLSDARFFWQSDKSQPLASRIPRLSDRIFYQGLGTLADKTQRMTILAKNLAPLFNLDPDIAVRAALLSKVDLSTMMVGEFPELQGIMGRYYALHDGEDARVAKALSDHYSPQGPGDICPKPPLSILTALIDKIDSLVGFFALGEKPSGSKDPYALRRAALGVIRLILENKLRVSLTQIFQHSLASYTQSFIRDNNIILNDLLEFFEDRIKVFLKEKSIRHDLVASFFAQNREDDFVRLLSRLEALQDFLRDDNGLNLLIAYRRAANIVRIEEKKESQLYSKLPLHTEILHEEAEIDLHKTLLSITPEIQKAIDHEDYQKAMTFMATLRVPVDHFFKTITVNSPQEEERKNRLILLARVRDTMNLITNFSSIEE